MAVNQSDKNSSEAPSVSANNSVVSKQDCQQTTHLMKLHGNSGQSNNSNVNGTSVNGGCSAENVSSIASSSNLEDQDPLLNNVSNQKQNDAGDIFKGENLQQLSTNALPPYTPGSPPGIMRVDFKAFDIQCCTDCGDTFAFKSSLNFHLERRSVLIKFPCETCKSTRIFYNRCNLLSHVRNHTDKNEEADIGKANVNVLPRVFMDGIQNEFVNTLDDELNSIEDKGVLTPSELLECSLQEFDEIVPDKEQTEIETPINIVKVKCLDCNEEFDTAKERQEHLTNGDKMPVLMSYCNKCGLMCPSKCSLKAHQRIHLQISPYVCPECGESPDPHWNNFLHHVNFKCFHNSRSVGYKCPVCKRVTPSNESLLKHMELHTEKYAKCSECPRAYNSASAFKAHNSIYHDGMPVCYTVIFKCSLCDIVFVSEDQMLNHRSTHLKEQMCEYVFNCMQCGKPVESKNLLMEHIKNTHPKIYRQNVYTEPTPINTAITQAVTYKGMVECLLCTATFYSHRGYSVHIVRAHINVNHKCECCNKVLSNRKEMVKHGKMHLEKKAIICLLCDNRKMHNSKELDMHLDAHTRKLKFCSACPICDHFFPFVTDAVNHLREEHSLPVRNERDSHSNETVSVSPNLDIVCHFCRSSFANDGDLQVHLKEKHNVDIPDSKRSPTSESSDQPLKKQRTEGSSCAKCDFQSMNREDFKKHIMSHKTNRSTFQCQECGLCFVVMPSLTKHLRIVHKISDARKYILEEGTNFVPDLENPTDVSKRSALECSVCFTSFPNETSLKTHMRSHGMAFIQANKSGLS